MSLIKARADGKILIEFSSQERHVLINLTEQIIELLGEEDGATHLSQEHTVDPLLAMMGISTSDAPPEDPVLLRLLPNAYSGAEESAEFRRYTEHGLREGKRANALMIREALLPQDNAHLEIVIEASSAMAWLSGINDIRLALAVRLDIGGRKENEDNRENGENNQSPSTRFELMSDSDPMKAVYGVYSWLGWFQESLITIL